MKAKYWDNVLKDVKDKLPEEEVPENHEIRFLEKLTNEKKFHKKTATFFNLNIAASIALFISIILIVSNLNQSKNKFEVARTKEIIYQKKSNLEENSKKFEKNNVKEKPNAKAVINIAAEKIAKTSSKRKKNNSVENTKTSLSITKSSEEFKKLEEDYKMFERDFAESGNKKVLEAMQKNLEIRQKIELKNEEKIKKIENYNLL